MHSQRTAVTAAANNQPAFYSHSRWLCSADYPFRPTAAPADPCPMAAMMRRLSSSSMGTRAGRAPRHVLARTLSSARFPTLDNARAMPRHMSEVGGENLFVLAEGGNQAAIRERVRREIMVKDLVDYPGTTVRLKEMSALCASNHSLYNSPFQLAIFTAGFSGFVSLPLVFSYPAASLFNTYMVTADPPNVGDADTFLEVGSWSWGWMEPPLGTISFFILCMQYVREKRLETGRTGAASELIQKRQGDLLTSTYGHQYDPDVLHAYGKSIAFFSDASIIEEEHESIQSRAKAGA